MARSPSTILYEAYWLNAIPKYVFVSRKDGKLCRCHLTCPGLSVGETFYEEKVFEADAASNEEAESDAAIKALKALQQDGMFEP